MKDLHLKQFDASAFMGISSEDPILIDFTKARKGANVVKLTGDQGTRKTSTMTALMYLMGAAFNIDTKNFKNITDEAIDISLEFEYEKSKYKVEATASRIVLKRFYKEADKWIPENSPKETLRTIFGNLGVSPMFLKELSGKKQIQWFKETFGNDEEATKKEQKIIQSIDTIFSQRRDVNRDIKNLKGALETEPLFQNYEKSQKKFEKPISAEKEKKAFDELSEKNRQYEKALSGLNDLKTDVQEKSGEIADLKEQLVAAEKEKTDMDARIVTGEKWISDNKGIPKQYETANEAWLNLSKTLSEYSKWKEVLKKEKEMIEMTEASTEADGKLDQLRVDLLKLTKTYLPDIEGLEIKVKTGLDEAEEGIYYQGRPIATLSESEIWSLFVKIWEQKDVQFVFCENVNSLGTDAIGVLNKLAKEGAVIFATEMERSKDHIEITIEAKIS